LRKGDIIYSSDGRRKVLAIYEEIIFLSKNSEFNEYLNGYTLKELISLGYQLEIPEEVTMEEVCKKFGKNVKIKK
jgi:hypothetical protein